MATVDTIFTGDTVRVIATFRDYAVPPAVGDVQDPDGDVTTVTIYDVDENIVLTGAGTKDDVGVYFYDWTAPLVEGTYYFEFKGMFTVDVTPQPQLRRQKLQVKFKPVTS